MTATLTQPTADKLERFNAGVPGVYEGIPADVYHALDACSNTAIGWMDDYSPEHCKYWRDHGKESTASQRLGTAAHMAVFEPDSFEHTYIAAGQCVAVKKDGTRCQNNGTTFHEHGWACGVHAKGFGETITLTGGVISQSDYAACVAIQQRAHRHTDLRPALVCEGYNELSVVWYERGIKLTCKARIDRWAKQVGMILDGKTTTNASESEFVRTAAKYRYHRQLAFYRRGLRAVGEDVRHCCIAAFEAKPPYGLMFYRASDHNLDRYDKVISAELHRFAECVESGAWEGYPQHAVTLDMPQWEERELEHIGGVI